MNIENMMNSEQINSDISIEETKKTNFNIFQKILNAPRVEKSLDEYLNHPLNINSDESISQMLRGMEGIFGNFDKAIFDILIGLFNKIAKKGGKA
jgi:hypothetical protein